MEIIVPLYIKLSKKKYAGYVEVVLYAVIYVVEDTLDSMRGQYCNEATCKSFFFF